MSEPSSSAPGRFGDVLTAMVTPFRADGSLDLDEAARLARWLVEHGSNGLVVAGTTGEASVLDDEEKLALWGTVRDAVAVPVIAGSGSNDTPHSVELTGRATEVGVDAILAVTPYYNRPSQAGIAAHFRAMAAATELPMILYDIPVRTGRKINTDTVLDLVSTVDNIVAVKDAAGSPAETARLIASAPAEGFEVYSGDDNLTLPLLSVGAVGVIGVATHWTGDLHREMIAAFKKGDVATARRINARLLGSFRYETGDDAPNPLPTKAMMRVLGFEVGHCRLPMGDIPAGLEDEARQVLADLEAD